jgi:hypothetical protein
LNVPKHLARRAHNLYSTPNTTSSNRGLSGAYPTPSRWRSKSWTRFLDGPHHGFVDQESRRARSNSRTAEPTLPD